MANQHPTSVKSPERIDITPAMVDDMFRRVDSLFGDMPTSDTTAAEFDPNVLATTTELPEINLLPGAAVNAAVDGKPVKAEELSARTVNDAEQGRKGKKLFKGAGVLGLALVSVMGAGKKEAYADYQFCDQPQPDGSCSHYITIKDRDGDRIADDQDKCPDKKSTNNRDSDKDGAGDICDPEPNNPCVPNPNSKVCSALPTTTTEVPTTTTTEPPATTEPPVPTEASTSAPTTSVEESTVPSSTTEVVGGAGESGGGSPISGQEAAVGLGLLVLAGDQVVGKVKYGKWFRGYVFPKLRSVHRKHNGGIKVSHGTRRPGGTPPLAGGVSTRSRTNYKPKP